MSDIRTVFDVGGRAMSAQMQRLNVTASNIANAGAIASSPEAAYRPQRPVFFTEFATLTGDATLSTTSVEQVVALDREPERVLRPDSPQADADGFVYIAPVNTEEEMVEMVDASRQYQNIVETMTTLRSLMARTLSMGQ